MLLQNTICERKKKWNFCEYAKYIFMLAFKYIWILKNEKIQLYFGVIFLFFYPDIIYKES